MSVGSYVVWNDLCQSVDSGEDDEGWPSYEAALSACSEGGPEIPAFHGLHGLVFGAASCAKAEAALKAADAREDADRARRAAVVASIAAQVPVAPAKPDRLTVLAKMLAANEASLAVELAKRKQDRAEVARLRDNCERLRGDLGILTPNEKLLKAIFG